MDGEPDTSALLELVRGRRGLLVASTGGHVSQLLRLFPRLGFDPDSVFVTFDGPQTRSCLAGRPVEWVPYVAPRAYSAMLRAVPQALRLIRRHRPEVVFSTGAGVAVPYLVAADFLGVQAVYLESVSRILAPSMSGRFLAQVPGVSTFTQHPHLTARRWRAGVSCLDEFIVERVQRPPLPDNLRVFVTLGTISPFRFDRLLHRMRNLVRPTWEVVWQTGCTTHVDLPGRVVEQLGGADFDAEVNAADVVVSHSGVGSAMRVLELGKAPVLIPREARFDEHVDDHQQQIATHLRERGLCETASADDLSLTQLQAAFERRVSRAFAGDDMRLEAGLA